MSAVKAFLVEKQKGALSGKKYEKTDVIKSGLVITQHFTHWDFEEEDDNLSSDMKKLGLFFVFCSVLSLMYFTLFNEVKRSFTAFKLCIAQIFYSKYLFQRSFRI